MSVYLCGVNHVCSTIYSFVTKSRRDTPDVLSMLWVCQYAPDLSAYVPMYVESERLSKAWITGSALVSEHSSLCNTATRHNEYCGIESNRIELN
jgi:hypothetical protein